MSQPQPEPSASSSESTKITVTSGTRVTMPPIIMSWHTPNQIRKQMIKQAARYEEKVAQMPPSYVGTIFDQFSDTPLLCRFNKQYITASPSSSPRTKIMTVDKWIPKSCNPMSRGRDFKNELYDAVNAKGTGGGFLVDTFPKLGDLRRINIVAHKDIPVVNFFTSTARHRVEGWQLLDDGRKDHWFHFETPIHKNRHKSTRQITVGNEKKVIQLHPISENPDGEGDYFYDFEGFRYMWRRSTQDTEDFFLTRKPLLGENGEQSTKAEEEKIASYWGLSLKDGKSEGTLEYVDEGPDGPFTTVDTRKGAIGGILFILEMLRKR